MMFVYDLCMWMILYDLWGDLCVTEIVVECKQNKNNGNKKKKMFFSPGWAKDLQSRIDNPGLLPGIKGGYK